MLIRDPYQILLIIPTFGVTGSGVLFFGLPKIAVSYT